MRAQGILLLDSKNKTQNSFSLISFNKTPISLLAVQRLAKHCQEICLLWLSTMQCLCVRVFHDGVYIDQAIIPRIYHQINACFQCFDHFCCLLIVIILQPNMLYCCMIFWCDSNFVAFRITFSTHLSGFLSILFQVIPKYVQHYPQYLILHLNFIVVKTGLLKESLFTTVLELLGSCLCEAVTNLACFKDFFIFL